MLSDSILIWAHMDQINWKHRSLYICDQIQNYLKFIGWEKSFLNGCENAWERDRKEIEKADRTGKKESTRYRGGRLLKAIDWEKSVTKGGGFFTTSSKLPFLVNVWKETSGPWPMVIWKTQRRLPVRCALGLSLSSLSGVSVRKEKWACMSQGWLEWRQDFGSCPAPVMGGKH